VTTEVIQKKLIYSIFFPYFYKNNNNIKGHDIRLIIIIYIFNSLVKYDPPRETDHINYIKNIPKEH